MAFASSQLPTAGAFDALIASRSAAGVTAQVAFGTCASIAVISFSARRPTLAALQLQTLGTCGAIHSRHTLSACVQTFGTDSRLHVIAVVTSVDTFVDLQQQ